MFWGQFRERGPVPVSLIPCSMCSARNLGEKLCHTTAAWNLAGGARRAYRHKLCVSCFVQVVAPLDTDNQALTCPGCHSDSESDLDPVYVTFYAPVVGKIQLEVPFDGACAAVWRSRFLTGAEYLPEREIESGGQDAAPRLSASDVWASLGLRPR